MNPRKGLTNVARKAVAKEASVAATTVAIKAATKWSMTAVKQAPCETIHKVEQLGANGILKSTQTAKVACKEVENIRGFTIHGVNQAIERKVSPGNILDTLKQPLKIAPVKIDEFGRPIQ